MSSTTDSVFGLTPPEKLQLVQDLWDDLASNPEDVPVYDWQLAEVARRKANLERHPAPTDWDAMMRRVRLPQD